MVLQTQSQLQSLEYRIRDASLREDLDAAQKCLEQAQEIMKIMESAEISATNQRQLLLAAETILAVSNRQIRLLLTRLLDTYGPGVLSLSSGSGLRLN